MYFDRSVTLKLSVFGGCQIHSYGRPLTQDVYTLYTVLLNNRCQRIRRTSIFASESAGLVLCVPANPQDLVFASESAGLVLSLPANPQDFCQRKRRSYGQGFDSRTEPNLRQWPSLLHGWSGPPGSMAGLALLAPCSPPGSIS